MVRLREPIELGQRVEAFTLEARVEGAWRRVAAGTTIGRTRLLRFPAVRGDGLRLDITAARACPLISEAGIFLAPPEVSIEGPAAALEHAELRLASDLPGAVIRYTLDGSDPDAEAALSREPIALDRSATVRARAWCEGRAGIVPAERRVRIVRTAELWPAREAAGPLEPGLRFAYREAALKGLGALESSPPLRAGVSRGIDLAVRERDENFSLVFEGFLRVPAEGIYTFWTRSDDGSRLLIDGRPVVENDGLHGMTERSGSAPLRAGRHALRIEYFNASGALGLEVRFAGPGIPRRPLPEEALEHAPERSDS